MTPNQLKIGGHVFNVVRANLPDKVGETDTPACTITIDSEVQPSIAGSTLIHEIFHACNSTLGESKLGHALIDSLSEQLYQVLSDNGLLNLDKLDQLLLSSPG